MSFGMFAATTLKLWRGGHLNGMITLLNFIKNLPIVSEVDREGKTDTQTLGQDGYIISLHLSF
jgi:hypothetical protein